MLELNNKTVREIVLELPASTRIFEEFKIDYCCGGQRVFNDACRVAGANPQIVSKKISQISELPAGGAEYKGASQLIDYIIEKHHVFTRDEIGRLTLLMEKVCYKHAALYPELMKLRKAFRDLCDDLTAHMRKEEFVLFPFIKSLERSRERNLPVPFPSFGSVQNPVEMMVLEHNTAGDILRRMREITHDFTAPDDACPSFKSLYFGLEELEIDLHQHIHLENNVLFPMSVELEQKVFGEM